MNIFMSLRPTKSQINFRKSQKISNIYLKRLLSYNSFYMLGIESTPYGPNRVNCRLTSPNNKIPGIDQLAQQMAQLALTINSLELILIKATNNLKKNVKLAKQLK